MITISGYRLELSDAKQVIRWKEIFDQAVLKGETKGMDAAQTCLHVFRKVFVAGLEDLADD